MATRRVLGIVLAGGVGQRLAPLTADRAKSAVPFGGLYRLVDFALSNLVNGEIRRICVLTQYKSHSLNRHLATAWGPGSTLGGQVIPVPAQHGRGPNWQVGSADAIHQSLSLLDEHRPVSLRARKCLVHVSTPTRTSTICGDELAGPSVQTILARRSMRLFRLRFLSERFVVRVQPL